MKSEFSRMIDIRQCEGKAVELEPNPQEREALAERFALVSVNALKASLILTRDGQNAEARGQLTASIVQSCAVSAEDLSVEISEPLYFRFVPENDAHTPDEEIELEAGDCDEIEYSGTAFDLGEAVAQSLALAIDPFAEGPGAEEARRKGHVSGEGASGPFAALAALKAQKD